MSTMLLDGTGNNATLYLETTGSSAIGLDAADSDKFKIVLSTASGAVLSGTPQLTIDPSANGDITVAPNGTGDLIVSSLGRGVVQTDASGTTSSSEGTDGQLLISSSAGAPAWANITSTGSTITVTNGNNTINLEAGGTIPLQFDTDGASATPAANAITIAGGTGITTSGAGSTVTIDLDSPVSVANGGTGVSSLTDHGVLLGSGTAAVSVTAVGTNGQVLLGATGADPAFATLTSTGGTVTFTPGANSLNLEATSMFLTITSIDNTDSPYTVLSSDQYISCDVSTDVITVQLPNSTTDGRVIHIKDATGNASSNNITVTTVGGAVNIDGATSYTMNSDFQAIDVIWNNTSGAWEIF